MSSGRIRRQAPALEEGAGCQRQEAIGPLHVGRGLRSLKTTEPDSAGAGILALQDDIGTQRTAHDARFLARDGNWTFVETNEYEQYDRPTEARRLWERAQLRMLACILESSEGLEGSGEKNMPTTEAFRVHSSRKSLWVPDEVVVAEHEYTGRRLTSGHYEDDGEVLEIFDDWKKSEYALTSRTRGASSSMGRGGQDAAVHNCLSYRASRSLSRWG